MALTLSACASWWVPSGPTLLQGQVRLNGNPGRGGGGGSPVDRPWRTRHAGDAGGTDAGAPAQPAGHFSLLVIDACRLPANGVHVLEARLYDSQGERARTQEDVRWRPGDQQAVELLLTAKPR